MSKAVFRYEGTIAQLKCDAMLAFFGAPVAHEDDPERAILAALDMIEVTDEFARHPEGGSAWGVVPSSSGKLSDAHAPRPDTGAALMSSF